MNKDLVLKSKGWQAVTQIGTFNEMFLIVMDNYEEMINIMRFIENLNIPYMQRYMEIYRKLNRAVFNFLSASQALVDHYRKLMKKYENTDFYSAYNEKRSDIFKDEEEIQFIKDFRNYQTHVCLKFAQLVNNKIIFFSNDLLQESDAWAEKSVKFINNKGKTIEIRLIFDKYYLKILKLYKWFHKELYKFHKDEIEETKRIANQIGYNLPQEYYQIKYEE